MCGIAGFFSPEIPEPQGRQFLRRMLRAIEHRGPDGEGTWSDSSNGLHLGMRRLSIIDLAGGTQPLWNEDRSLAVFFNGEIYNYVELRRELEAAGHTFRTQSDTEVLVHLFERDGLEFFHSLRGMFAIALYDLRKKRLLLARDHAGQKPLFYYRDAHRLAFGSELKTLLTLPFVPDIPNPDAFLDYISWMSLPATVTHFQHIHKLPPGSYLDIDLARPDAAPVRSFLPEPDNALRLLTDPDEAVEALDAALKRSVEIHLRADVPVGIMLSSGLDSQTVAAYVQDVRPGEVSTFTAVFNEGESEQEGAEATARLIGSRHHNIPLTATDLGEQLPRLAWFLDEPVGDPAAFAVYRVAQYARDHVKVLLGGEGADELFAGYTGRYSGLLQTLDRSNRLRRWLGWLPHWLPEDTSLSFGRAVRRAHLTPGQETALLRVEGLPNDIRAPLGLSRGQLKRLEERAHYYSSITYKDYASPLETLLHFDRRWQLPESLLVKADRMSMAASIELRSPFLDWEIQELADKMAMGLKLPHGGAGKWILFQCLQRRFPRIERRAKKGFPIPLSHWLAGPLRPQVEESLLGSRSTLSGLIEPAARQQIWNAFLGGQCPPLIPYALWLYDTWRHEFPRRIETLRNAV